MARALVLHLLLAGAAAMPTHGTSEVDDPIAGHLHDRADASDHATSHSHHPRPIDEEVADAHDQHALTPPDGNDVRHVHRSARGQSRPVGTPDAALERGYDDGNKHGQEDGKDVSQTEHGNRHGEVPRPDHGQDDVLEVEGKVLEALDNAKFRVKLEDAGQARTYLPHEPAHPCTADAVHHPAGATPARRAPHRAPPLSPPLRRLPGIHNPTGHSHARLW